MKTGHKALLIITARPEVRYSWRERTVAEHTAPLSVPEGAIYLDTSAMTEDEVLGYILDRVKAALTQ